ncbi:MAG: glycosyltransferase family 2 protein, partial [Nanoarchaeota archaeon]|nr:glycosyltransferase family 2 protein [Nanoarchaeota archaeon]
MKEIELSIVIPIFNERENLILLHNNVLSVLKKMAVSYEIIFVDDGSRDGSLKILEDLKKKNSCVKLIFFRTNFGQTAALDAGFKYAKGKFIVAMDADLQNDPEDIPRLLVKLNQGYDCVSGWRKNRKDGAIKHLTSRFANLIRKIILNDKIHDSGCTLKVYKKECFLNMDLFGEMHRFIPAMLEWKGFKVTEIADR